SKTRSTLRPRASEAMRYRSRSVVTGIAFCSSRGGPAGRHRGQSRGRKPRARASPSNRAQLVDTPADPDLCCSMKADFRPMKVRTLVHQVTRAAAGEEPLAGG